MLRVRVWHSMKMLLGMPASHVGVPGSHLYFRFQLPANHMQPGKQQVLVAHVLGLK